MKGYQRVKRYFTSFKYLNRGSDPEDYNRVEKCYTHFKNIKNNLERNTGNTIHIFRDILETEKCDELSNFTKTRTALFKEVDDSIIKKLQTKNRLNDNEEDVLEELRTNKKEYLMRYIEPNIRECVQKMKDISLFQYYMKETEWKNLSIKLLLLERGFTYLMWIGEKLGYSSFI